MSEGRYVYCIFEGDPITNLGKIGIHGNDVYSIKHNKINAAVSSIPFKEFEPNIENISAHQRVIEEARKFGTTVPVRFGVLIKEEDGVKNLLKKSYSEFTNKISKLRGKDEYGVKVFLQQKNHKIFQEFQTKEIKKLKKDIAASSEGTSYFLKLKLEEAIKNESLKRIEEISQQIHKEISEISTDSCLLNDELDDIILNGAYLINKNQESDFTKKFVRLKNKYKELKFHISGPWAPYSFC